MEKKTDPSLFVNDGSFMERYRQLQQEKQAKEAAGADEPKSSVSAGSSTVVKPAVIPNKRPMEIKGNDVKKPSPSPSNGKLAFSFKKKSKVVAPAIKLGEDDEEERGDSGSGSGEESVKRQKLGAPKISEPSLQQGDVAPSPPSDPTVRTVADRLATFAANKGRQIEHVTRQKNPGDTPFKFLFDSSCSDYKYYEYRLNEEIKALEEAKGSHATDTISVSAQATKSSSMSQRCPVQQHFNYQTPASALYEASEDAWSSEGSTAHGESSKPPAADPIAMMEYYMKKAAQEERKRPPKYSKDEMPPPDSLQGTTSKKGHHMGDYIPQEELEKFLASCNDAAARKAAREAAEKAKIQADNIGHKLLSKMGWREGRGSCHERRGRADLSNGPGAWMKQDHLGVGATRPDQVKPEDDIYEQYKKRMMLGYKHRPNPLGNPRRAYY
ncbi:LOW QUALITY PROTEIN: SURP and G-patch domain-containing protein 1-like protein [Asparagus officinalis]|uniref:LOW QUALITY PROTEIN: SURP and G-patch domain-containing protein 1-like protein n=1 Tax=Asparagus officinalis TaxID=4686 RepID=UPI00098E70A8|nr:LOW QUALITY PROTEIN: SURP and G-patch domain-containing protein 1-like protein [Asparagus officinalis]